jgi:hypothetical protein
VTVFPALRGRSEPLMMNEGLSEPYVLPLLPAENEVSRPIGY